MLKKFICGFIILNFLLTAFITNQTHAEEKTTVLIEVESDAIINQLESTFPTIQIKKKYSSLFNGFSASIPFDVLQQLESFEGIKNIYPNNSYQVSLDESVAFIGGETIRENLLSDYRHVTGEGIKVGVIDTGVDYTHPDLAKNFKGGFDVVDQDDDPMETKEHQGPPTLHGTHVAGIIGANGKIKGVAPDVELYGYRTLGPGGVGTTEQVIEAIEKAVEDGMDLINLSLGNSVNGPDWPTSIAIDKAVEKGVIAVTSNGNSGPNLWTVGSPGTSLKAISVGASTPPIIEPFIKVMSDRKEIPILPINGSIPWPNLSRSKMNHDYKLISGGIGNKTELSGVEGKVVIMMRGDIPFTEKAVNAEEAGAAGVLIYNNEEGMFSGLIEGSVSIPVAAISKADGEFLLSKMEQGTQWIETVFQKSSDKIAGFSSRGPVAHSWEIKPDISAPGVQIDSTVPSGYMALQGTSMSAPHITGVAALIKQVHPNWNPEQVKSAIMNTAKQLYQDEKQPYSSMIQGTGRVQLEKALSTESLIYPSTLSFGQLEANQDRNKITKTITLENLSTEVKRYTFQQPTYSHGVQWQLPYPVILNGGEKKEVKVALDINPAVIKKGLHEGGLKVEENGHITRIPYLFVIGQPEYPRIMGFDFRLNEETDVKADQYKYELYLPEGADEFGVTFYEADSLRKVYTLLQKEGVERGRMEGVINRKDLPLTDGIYKVIAYANKYGKEDYMIINTVIGNPVDLLNKKEDVSW